MVTLNIAVFVALDRSWRATGRTHSGILLVSTTSFQQDRGVRRPARWQPSRCSSRQRVTRPGVCGLPPRSPESRRTARWACLGKAGPVSCLSGQRDKLLCTCVPPGALTGWGAARTARIRSNNTDAGSSDGSCATNPPAKAACNTDRRNAFDGAKSSDTERSQDSIRRTGALHLR